MNITHHSIIARLRATAIFTLAIFSLFAASPVLEAQDVADEKWWVFFTDKEQAEFTLDSPQDFLSEKALERRERFNIPLSQSDMPVSSKYLSTLTDLGVKVRHPSKWLNATSVYVSDQNQIQAIKKLPFVSSVRPVGRHHGELDEVLSSEQEIMSPVFAMEQLAEGETYFGEGWGQLDLVCGSEFQLQGYIGEGILIAVMDAGFPQLENFDFYERMVADNRLLEGYDFVDDDTSIYEDHRHGRNVFSIMAADLPGSMIGSAPGASYVLYRTEDVSSEKNLEEDNWIAAAEAADALGVDVFNTSLGYSEFDDGENSYTYEDLDGNTALITKAADMAAGKGILVVNSAGNEGNGAWKYITTPADGDSVLAVGAVAADGNRMSFSSYGPTADGRVKPNVMAWGGSTAYLNGSGEVERGNGTSYSSPVIAGLAACLMQANPNKTNMEIFSAIERSADSYFSPSDSMGYGIPNFCLAHKLLNWEGTVDRMTVFPNPIADHFRLIFEGTEGDLAYFELYDLSGRLHRSYEYLVPNSGTVEAEFRDLGRLSPGFYSLRLITPNNTSTVRVYKQ